VNAMIIYWTAGGNTEKVALAIREGLQESGATVSLRKVQDAADVDFDAYDLVCVGFPSYQWSPPQPMDRFLKDKFEEYRKQGRIVVGAPKAPRKNALIFCTYSGQHTGLREATPALLYAGQYFEHLGFAVLGEWHVVGQFHGNEEANTQGPLGDIRGRPNAEDLARVREDARRLGQAMKGGQAYPA